MLTEETKERIEITKTAFKDKLTTKFSTSCILFLIITFIVQGIIFSVHIRKESTQLYNEYSTSMADTDAEKIAYWLDSGIKTAYAFANSETFKNGNFESVSEYLVQNSRLIDSFFSYAGIVDLDGTMITSQNKQVLVSDRDYFKNVASGKASFYIDNPSKGRSTNTVVFHLAVPVKNKKGELTMIFVAIMSIDTLQQEIEKVQIGESGFAYVLSSDGTIIAHPQKDKLMTNSYINGEYNRTSLGMQEITRKMLNGERGMGTVTSLENKSIDQIYYAPVRNTNWSIAVSVPKVQILSTSKKIINFMVFIYIASSILLALIFSAILFIIIKPIQILKESVTDISKGDADLTKKIELKAKNEIGEVVTGFNNFMGKLHEIISNVKDSKSKLQNIEEMMKNEVSETASSINQIIANIQNVTSQLGDQTNAVDGTASAVTEISQNIESLNHMIENQSLGIQQASSAVEQMIGNITSITTNVEKMSNSFDRLEENAKIGISKQNLVNEQISQIEEQSNLLFEANNTIASIAEQTNLLAMNAAIEAAHAGEAGKGFSVVADEIRKLSETSTQESLTIGDNLKKIQTSINDVVVESNDAKNAFANVSQTIQETDQLVHQITDAMTETQEGSKQINNALRLMNDSTSEVRTASIEMAEGNKTILDEISLLQQATNVMKDCVSEMSSGATHITDVGNNLTSISQTMGDSIKQIGNQIDLFKV